MKTTFKFKSRVIVWGTDWRDNSAWRFARLPEDISAKIKEMQKGRLRRGWGAVYAKAKVIRSVPKFSKENRDPGSKSLGEWTTSIFPVPRFYKTGIPVLTKDLGNRHSATYILPLKKSIRYEENLYDGLTLTISLTIWF